MKTFILICQLVLSLNAQALSLNDYIRANVVPVKIDATSPLARLKIQAAQINFNTAKSELTLTLNVTSDSCPIDMVCPAVIPEPVVINLPKLEQITDACGNVTYIGSTGDGLAGQAILFTDFANSTCQRINGGFYEVEYQVLNKFDGTTSTAIFTSTDHAEQVGLPVVPPASL